MRYIQIEEAEAGMIIAKPVFDGGERILLGVNSVLTQDYLNSLIRRGLPGIYIKDEWSENIEIEDVISEKLRNEGINALKNNDIDGTLNVAKKIVDEILSGSVISLDMLDLKSYDGYTYQHSVNVAVVSCLIGLKMGFSKQQLEEVSMAAILHDIGKILISQDIINKPGRLTKEEYELVKKHSEYGYEIVKNRMDISAKVKSAILMHHENEDGSGYPNGLVGEQIPLGARILKVADEFAALISDRWEKAEEVENVYKPEVSEQSDKKEDVQNELYMAGGHMTLSQLEALLNAIPMEITFVDEDNINRYFNEGSKVFKRPVMAIDREVFSCHPPKIEAKVRRIIEEFRIGTLDEVPVWMYKQGRTMLVKYIAVRDKQGNYVGTLEAVQDMEFAKEHFAKLK